MHRYSCPGGRVMSVPDTVGAAALSTREMAILRLLAEGHTVKAAASLQGIGYQTTKNYLTTAYDKLGAVGMVDAFVILGWLKVPK